MVKESEEKAIEIYDKLQVYRWDEELGNIPDDEETLKKCNYMVDEIILLYSDKTYSEIAFWGMVKNSFKDL